jgi:hypothetical protein
VEVSAVRVRPTFGASRRWAARFHGAASAILACYILFLSNLIVFRRPCRFDWTEEKLSTLSPATRGKLKLVEEPILVVIPLYFQRDNPENAAEREVLERARFLLNEYMAAQPLIKVAAEVDMFGEPDRWERVREEYGLTGAQGNRFIFIAGPAKERRQGVTARDMATFVPGGSPLVPPEVKDFRAEKAMTDAIARLIARERRAVYFADSGEVPLAPEGPAARRPSLLNVARRELETEGYEPRVLSLETAGEVPSDCAILVIAGPSQPLTSREIDLVRRYLAGGGKLFAALGPARTGLEDLLADWGVKVLDGSVSTVLRLPGVQQISASVPVRDFNAFHPITRIFKDAPRFEILLEAPRPLAGGGGEKGLDATYLAGTGPPAKEETFVLSLGPGLKEASKAEDVRLAFAVEQRVPDRPPPGFERLETRLVVVGAAGFLRDTSLPRASHRDFLASSLAWLVGEEERAAVGGGEWASRRLRWDASIQRFFFWVPVFLIPGIFLALGGLIYYWRRS